jgi:hypothetical protein
MRPFVEVIGNVLAPPASRKLAGTALRYSKSVSYQLPKISNWSSESESQLSVFYMSCNDCDRMLLYI